MSKVNRRPPTRKPDSPAAVAAATRLHDGERIDRYAVCQLQPRPKLVARMLHKSEADAYAKQWAKRHGVCVAVEEPFILPAADDVLEALDDFHAGPLALAFYDCVSNDRKGPFRRIKAEYVPADLASAVALVEQTNRTMCERERLVNLIGIFPRELTVADESEVANG